MTGSLLLWSLNTLYEPWESYFDYFHFRVPSKEVKMKKNNHVNLSEKEEKWHEEYMYALKNTLALEALWKSRGTIK